MLNLFPVSVFLRRISTLLPTPQSTGRASGTPFRFSTTVPPSRHTGRLGSTMSYTMESGTGSCGNAESFSSECLSSTEIHTTPYSPKHWQSQWHTVSVFHDSATQPNRMRENRLDGSERGESQLNATSLHLSFDVCHMCLQDVNKMLYPCRITRSTSGR